MDFYRRNLPHFQKDFTPHFITFVSKFRWILPPVGRDIVLSCCLLDHGIRYELYVAVVMPDHVHVVLTPLLDEGKNQIVPLPNIMRAIKSASAHLINRRLNRQGPVWQEESFDHVPRSSEGLDAKVEYVLQNSVRRGLVKDWQEYAWAWQRKDQPIAEMRLAQV
jgi:REP element-mobilizing transposase RayT